MELVSKKVAAKLGSKLNLDQERIDVIAYGLFAMFQTLFLLLTILILGLIFHTTLYSVLIFLSVGLLRKYSGGAHATSVLSCNVVSIITCIGFGLICAYALDMILTKTWWIAGVPFAFGISLWIIYHKAPVENSRKPIRTNDKRIRMRRGSFLVLTGYMVCCIFLLMIPSDNNITQKCAVAILFGMLWQTFSLTKIGTICLMAIDSILATK